MRFVDTNILLYVVSTAEEERRKAAIARELLNDPDLALSVQVLQEFYVQATRTSRSGRLTHEQASALITSWLRFTVADMTLGVVQAALAATARYQLSYWDAAIIESARGLGCGVVLSEDFTQGRDYDGVTIVDPFRG